MILKVIQRPSLSGAVVVLLGVLFLVVGDSPAQVSPDEHAEHHPDQAESGSAVATDETPVAAQGGMGGGGMGGGKGGGMGGGGMGGGKGGGMGGGGMGGGKGGGMGGGKGGMKGRRGPSSPEELFPQLMTLPNLSPEQRLELQRQAHRRMLDGTALLSEGFDDLSAAAAGDDFRWMQDATARLREGLMQFESGLAAHRAIAEGKAPRNIALQWFQRELNLLPPVSREASFSLWGMKPFHAITMLLLATFTGAMIWMYVLKMRRAGELLQRLTAGGESLSAESPPIAQDTAVSTAPAVAPMAGGKPKKWSGQLRLAGVFQETPDVKTFRFVDPDGGVLPFTYLPGQFLTLKVEPDGKPVKRSYTIASSPTQRDYLEITVKREEQGLVSRHLHDTLKPGDALEVSAPSGNLTFTGEEGDGIVLVAAGVGVTPIMSVARYLTDRYWDGEIYVLFVCRTATDIIFRDELERLADRYPSLKLLITLSRPDSDWTGAQGRLSKDSFSEFVPEIAKRRVHICGPKVMMDATKDLLIELGVPKDQVKMEAFGPAKKAEPKTAVGDGPADSAPQATGTAVVTFRASDKSAPLPKDQTILDVADELGVEIENSCRAGSCGSCKVKLLEGEVTMDTEDALEDDEKSEGIILACQAMSEGNIVVDA